MGRVREGSVRPIMSQKSPPAPSQLCLHPVSHTPPTPPHTSPTPPNPTHSHRPTLRSPCTTLLKWRYSTPCWWQEGGEDTAPFMLAAHDGSGQPEEHCCNNTLITTGESDCLMQYSIYFLERVPTLIPTLILISVPPHFHPHLEHVAEVLPGDLFLYGDLSGRRERGEGRGEEMGGRGK